MTEGDGTVLVGRVAKPHGLRGHVAIKAETDFAEARFARGATLLAHAATGRRTLVVVESRMQSGRPVVRFEGVETIDDAERLVGQELRIAEEGLAPLGAGRYYHHQLEGCVVETVPVASGVPGLTIGLVARVDTGAGGSLLVVTGSRGEVLIPLATDICTDVDVTHRRIRVQLPEGLLDLNAPGAGHKAQRR